MTADDGMEGEENVWWLSLQCSWYVGVGLSSPLRDRHWSFGGNRARMLTIGGSIGNMGREMGGLSFFFCYVIGGFLYGAGHLAGHWLRWMRWNIFRFGIGSDVTAGVPRGLGSTRGLDLFYCYNSSLRCSRHIYTAAPVSN